MTETSQHCVNGSYTCSSVCDRTAATLDEIPASQAHVLGWISKADSLDSRKLYSKTSASLKPHEGECADYFNILASIAALIYGPKGAQIFKDLRNGVPKPTKRQAETTWNVRDVSARESGAREDPSRGLPSP